MLDITLCVTFQYYITLHTTAATATTALKAQIGVQWQYSVVAARQKVLGSIPHCLRPAHC